MEQALTVPPDFVAPMIALQFRVCVADAIPTAPIVVQMGDVDPALADPWDMRGDPPLGLSEAGAATAFITLPGRGQTVDRGALLQTVLCDRRPTTTSSSVILDLCVETASHFTVLLKDAFEIAYHVPLEKHSTHVRDVARVVTAELKRQYDSQAEFGPEEDYVFTDESEERLVGHLASFPSVRHGKTIHFTVNSPIEVQATLWETRMDGEEETNGLLPLYDIEIDFDDIPLAFEAMHRRVRLLLLFPFTATLSDIRRKFASAFGLPNREDVFNLYRSEEGRDTFTPEPHLKIVDRSLPGRQPMTILSLKVPKLGRGWPVFLNEDPLSHRGRNNGGRRDDI